MRLSKLFTKTSKTTPADETARNAQLLIQAGFIHKEMAGVYAFLPLGLRVLEKIKTIVSEEMNALDSYELIMTSLQRKEVWEKTGRWNDEVVDVWFKTVLKNGTELGLAWSHEEQITEMMKNFISSYRDLPASLYQFQTKLRNEVRAKSGIMRSREFVMNDMYTYSRTAEELQEFYDQATKAYLNVYKRVGLGEVTFFTFASGGAFTQFSHEFQTITDAGEDIIYVDRKKNLAVNEEVYTDEVLAQLGLNKDELEKVKTAEVGNIFNFGTKKSEQMGLYFVDENAVQQPVYLSSYGLGVTRLMGVIVEHFADDRGLVWPENIAPAKIYLARLGENEAVVKVVDELYRELEAHGIETLYDDRNLRPGEKFADADLMGIPYRVVVSDKTISAGLFELKERTKTETHLVDLSKLLNL